LQKITSSFSDGTLIDHLSSVAQANANVNSI